MAAPQRGGQSELRNKGARAFIPSDFDESVPRFLGDDAPDEPVVPGIQDIDELTSQECRERLLALLQGEATWDAALHRELLRQWLTLDRGSLQAWLITLVPGPLVEETRLQTGYLFSETDLPGALKWAHELRSDTNALTLVLGIVGEAVRHDPRQGLDVLRELPPSSHRDDALERAVMEWAARSGKDVGQWVGLIEDESLRRRLSGAAALGMAATDPEQAARLAVSQMTPGDAMDRVVVTIVQHWVQRAPGEAAAWVESFPATEVRRAAAESLVRLWANADPAALRAWIQGLPEGALRQQVVAVQSRLGL